MFTKYFLCFSLCPLPLVLSLGTTEKSSVLFAFSLQVFIHIDKIPLSLFFSRLNIPSSLSLSLHARCSSPLIIFVALHWTVSSMSWKRVSKWVPGNIAQNALGTVVFSLSFMLSKERMVPCNVISNVASSVKDLYWLNSVFHTSKKIFVTLFFTDFSGTCSWEGVKLFPSFLLSYTINVSFPQLGNFCVFCPLILSSEDSLDTTKEDMNEGHKVRLRKN